MLESNPENCIIYNCMLYNSNTFTSEDVLAFGGLGEYLTTTNITSDYYFRSKKIVTTIKNKKGNTTETWDYYHNLYFTPLINTLKTRAFDQGIFQIQQMMTAIEKEFSITTPVAGISKNAYVPFYNKQLKDVAITDRLLVLKNNLNETEESAVYSLMTSVRSLVKLVTVSGITLTCASITPVPLEYGEHCTASDCAGKNIPVMDNGVFRWELCNEVVPCGTGEVINIITADNQCYAAGDEDNRWIWTQRVPVELI